MIAPLKALVSTAAVLWQGNAAVFLSADPVAYFNSFQIVVIPVLYNSHHELKRPWFKETHIAAVSLNKSGYTGRIFEIHIRERAAIKIHGRDAVLIHAMCSAGTA